MKILGIVAIVLGWMFLTLFLIDMAYAFDVRDFITITIASIGEILITIGFIFLIVVACKE